MNIETLAQDKYKSEYLVSGTNCYYMNTLRRIIILKVPTMAIAKVRFLENSSALYDEMLAHRLGLIPLKTDLHSYNLRSECKCKGKGCAACTLHLTLNAEGPCNVYAESLISKDPKVKAVYPKMPIVNLLENQKLKIEATAVLGSGKEHTKFVPGHIYFQGKPEFKMQEFEDSAVLEKAVKLCPKKILEISGKKAKVANALKCTLCKACEDASNGAIKVYGSKEDFILRIESWGQLRVKEIIEEGISVMDKQFDELSVELKKIGKE
ncbi:DNA-directed RNA polymerase subunit D [archaeon]|nr:DNA-directed RNA polymerase subunit D [archaeon]